MYWISHSNRRIAVCVWVEVPNFFGSKFSIPDANAVNRKFWHCHIAFSNSQGELHSKGKISMTPISIINRGMTPIHKKLRCTIIYWDCNEIPFHERGQGDPCIKPWKYISASYSQSTFFSPYAEPDCLKKTTAIINESIERGSNGMNPQPKRHGHSGITITGIEKAAACANSKIHISHVAINVDSITNHTGYESSSIHQRAIQGSKHHISLNHIQVKCHHWIYKI